MSKIKVIQLDLDHTHSTESAEKNDDGTIETEDGAIAISPAAVFPMGGDTRVPTLDALCNMPTPPPVLKPKAMAVLAFQGAALPVEHVSVYTDGMDIQQRTRLRSIAITRIARQEVGQRQTEMTASQKQHSDLFIFLWKVLGAVFVLAVVAIVFILYTQGGAA